MTKRREIPLQNKGKLIISKELQSKILYLHSRVKNIEWSGYLIYEIVEGSIARPSSLVCKAIDMVVKDVGTAAYTEYEFDESDMDVYDEYPGLMTGELKRGVIHTHHNMSTFFSGTDMGELHDNAPKYVYYLSLIVNHASQYMAKIALIGIDNRVAVDHSITVGSEKIELVADVRENEQEVLVLIDLEIEIEQAVDFVTKVSELLKPKPTTYSNHYQTKAQSWVDRREDPYDMDDDYYIGNHKLLNHGAAFGSEDDDVDTKLKECTMTEARTFLTVLVEGEPRTSIPHVVETVFRRKDIEIKKPEAWARNIMKTQFFKTYQSKFGREYDQEDILETCITILMGQTGNQCARALSNEFRKTLNIIKV